MSAGTEPNSMLGEWDRESGATHGVDPPELRIQEQLLAAQVRLLYQQMRTGAIGAAAAAMMCGALAWSAELPWVSYVPVGLVLAVAGLRVTQVWQFTHHESRRPIEEWRRLAVATSVGVGVSWGLLMACIFPWAPVELKVVLACVAYGMSAAGLTTMAPVRASYLAFSLPLLAGLVVSTALFFPRYPWPMAALSGLFAVVMIRASRDRADTLASSLRLSIEKQVLVVQLLTARERAEDARGRAEAANQAKSQFLARMSHEIRTPLNGVLGMHELLLTSSLGAEERRFVETAEQSGRALLTLINDVLDFSKIEAGKVTLVEAPFRVERLLEELMALFAIGAHDKGLLLFYELDEAVPEQVVGDEFRLRQVLTNLLGNAIKFTATGEVTLWVKARAGGVHFAVRDTGPGVDARHRERIFQSFEQADGSITRRFGGTGLGLAISRQLVELMGGSLELESEVGRGSEFSFTARLAPGPALEAAPPLGAGRRAIVALSHPRLRASMTRWLGAAAFRVDDREAATRVEDASLVVVDDAAMDEAERARKAGVPTLVCQAWASLAGREDERAGRVRVPMPLRRSMVLEGVGRLLLGETSQPERSAAEPKWESARVLVVDDDAVNRTLARAMLERLGCTPAVLAGGSEALAVMEHEPFDLVLMDCEMPDVDGLTVTREVRRKERERGARRVPVVALTAHATQAQRDLCLGAGMDEMVTKPLGLARLEACLVQWLPSAPPRRSGS